MVAVYLHEGFVPKGSNAVHGALSERIYTHIYLMFEWLADARDWVRTEHVPSTIFGTRISRSVVEASKPKKTGYYYYVTNSHINLSSEYIDSIKI